MSYDLTTGMWSDGGDSLKAAHLTDAFARKISAAGGDASGTVVVPFPGAVPRTLAAKLAEAVSIGDLGPPGAGGDARAALVQADAVATALGVPLRITGVRRIASNVTLTSGHVEFDPGAALVPDSGAAVTFVGRRRDYIGPFGRPSVRERSGLPRWDLDPTVESSPGSGVYVPSGVFVGGADVDLYGETAMTVTARDRNAVIGVSAGYIPNAFPSGVTGVGISRFAGGTAFGLHGRAYQYVVGCATNEWNNFNMAGPPDASLPPVRSFGSPVVTPIVETIAPGGLWPASVLSHYTREGSTLGTSSLRGIVVNSDVVTGDVFVALATPTVGAQKVFNLQYAASFGQVLAAQAMGSAVAGRPIIALLNAGGASDHELRQGGDYALAGRFVFTASTSFQATVGAAGNAAPLPVKPTRWLRLTDDTGAALVIPAFAAS